MLLEILAALVVLVALVLRYNYADAFPEAAEIVKAAEGVEVVQYWWGRAFVPDEAESKVALLYLPGALVESTAYAPLMIDVARRAKATTCLVDPPGRVAFLGLHRAAAAVRDLKAPAWAVGGHSLGGVIAGWLADRCKQEADVVGLVLHASFAAKPDLRTLQVLASNDVTNRSVPDATVVTVQGGNHAGFAYYGPHTCVPRVRR